MSSAEPGSFQGELIRDALQSLQPYEPGKPVEEIQREYELDRPPVKLASNENPHGPPPNLIERYRESFERLNRYPDGACYYLRQALSDHVEWPARGIFVGGGTDEVLDCLGKATIRSGDEVVTGDPAFIRYPMITRIMGGKPVEVPVTASFDLDLEAMLSRVNERTRWVCLPNPNNPTSRYIDGSSVEDFLRALPAGCGVILDEAYFELMDEKNYPSGVEMLHRFGSKLDATLVVLRTFSKAYGLAGLRVGYGVMPPDLADELHKVRPSFNVNHPAQVMARFALDEDEFLRRSRSRLQSEKQRLVEALRDRGWEVVPPSANFMLVEVPSETTTEALCEALLERGIIVRSMRPYGLGRHVRLSVGTAEENDRFLKALDDVDGG